jgi:hypothetical protein
LRTAIAAGGRLTFQCGGAPATIRITSPLAITIPIQIDGEGRITLLGVAAGTLFQADTPRLELRNLQIRNDATGGLGIVRGSAADLVLQGVTTSNTANAYVAKSISVRDSVFEANGVSGGVVGVILDAERVHLTNATFNKNFDHPIAGGQPPERRGPLSREITVDASVFTGNSASILALDAVVTIRGSKFTSNGTGPGDSLGTWECCGGVLTAVNSRVAFIDSELVGNSSTGAGGAISAIGSEVRIFRTLLQSNSASVGGAIFSWSHRPKNNIWSSAASARLAPGLTLNQVRFHQNSAQYGGGAVAWAGSLNGNAALFATNRANTGGAIAHWSAITLPDELKLALAGLVDQTEAAEETLGLSKGIFADNQARESGAAMASGNAKVALGNSLVIRNSLASGNGIGAAIEGSSVDLANSTIADNAAGGVRIPPPGQRARIVNSIVQGNALFGCSIPAGKQEPSAGSWQYPGKDCAAAIVRAARLSNYKPSAGSAEVSAGDVGLCLSEPQVAGLDLASTVRGKRGNCSIGAYEPDPSVDPVFGWSVEENPWLRWIVMILVFLFLLAGFFTALWWVRRRRTSNAPPSSTACPREPTPRGST